MKYVLLIYTNPAARQLWESMSQAEQSEGIEAYAALNDELASRGELIVTEALTDASLATQVTLHDGQTMTSDGPFAEAKELLAGFYLVECDSVERAIEIAAQVPEVSLGRIEVRPVLTYSGLEM